MRCLHPKVVVFGATGYIGKYVTRELVARGFHVSAVTRGRSGVGGKSDVKSTEKALPGADLLVADGAWNAKEPAACAHHYPRRGA